MEAAAQAPLCSRTPLATRETPGLLPAGAGLGGTVAVGPAEPGDELQAIRARGYWEQVWLRFRRDKLAITSGLFIVFLFIVAFAGAPLAEWLLGHGPNDIYAGGVDQNLQPVGPDRKSTRLNSSHIQKSRMPSSA